VVIQTPNAVGSGRLQGVCQYELADEFDVAEDVVSEAFQKMS
jgi:hypothetical protein